VSSENITQLIKKIHEEEGNKQLLEDVLKESEKGFSEEILLEVQSLLKKANKSNVIEFPKRTVQLGQTELMAASGQNLGEWFAQPIIFESSGMIIDVRKVIGSEDEVDVYIQPNSDDCHLIEQSLFPFKDKTLQVRLSVNGKDLLQAEIYIDESGHSAEGSGHLQQVDEDDVHGKLDLEIIVEE
jgi:hypothetical protein